MSYPIISDFGRKTPNFFLSNFYPISITVTFLIPKAGTGAMDVVTETYPSVEHAYQAAKTFVAEERREFQRPYRDLYPGTAKKMGQFVTIRKDWNSAKVSTMVKLLELKFENTDLRERLLETAPSMLIEGNYWHDNFWGVCFCPKGNKGCQAANGLNTLGRLLMNLRSSLQSSPKENPVVTTVTA